MIRGSAGKRVDDLTWQVRARGLTVRYEGRHLHAGGEQTCALYFEDPDRFKVEVVAPL